MEALLKEVGAANPEANEKETTKSPGGIGDQSKIGEMKAIKINSKLPKVSSTTDSGTLRSEMLNLANQVNSQTTMPMGKILLDGGIYAFVVGKITKMNIREMETILNDFKSAENINADEAAAIKEQIMSFYPKTAIVGNLDELSASFDKAHKDLTKKLGVDGKDPKESGVSELIVAVAELGTKAIELYSSQMECEVKILTAASTSESILEFVSVEGRYLTVQNFGETFRQVKVECDRVKPIVIDILRNDDPVIGQNAMLDDVLADSPRNVADHIVGLGCSIDGIFSHIIGLCKPAAGSSDSKAKLNASREQLMNMVEAMQFSGTEYRLDTILEAFGVKGREYLSTLEADDSPQARAMQRELGNDKSIAGLFLTMMDLKIDVKKGVKSMSAPAASEFVKLVGKVQSTYGQGGTHGPEKSMSTYYARSRWNGLTAIFAVFANDFQPEGKSYEVTEVAESAMMAKVGAPAMPDGKRYADIAKSADGITSIDGEILKTINGIPDPNQRLKALLEYKDKGTRSVERDTSRATSKSFKLAFLHSDDGRECNYCGGGTSQRTHEMKDCMGRQYDRDNNTNRHFASTARRWFELNDRKVSEKPPQLWNADENAIRNQMTLTGFKPGMPNGDKCYTRREEIFADAERRALPKSQRSNDGRGRGRGRGGYHNATAYAATTNSAPSTGQTQPAKQAGTAAQQPDTAGADNQMTEMHAMLVKLNDRVTEVQTFQKNRKNRKKQQVDWSADDTDQDTDDDQ